LSEEEKAGACGLVLAFQSTLPMQQFVEGALRTNSIERRLFFLETIAQATLSKLPESWVEAIFTQEGVSMLSGVLRSPRAVQVNIAIMRVFVRLRETLALNKELAHKLAELERKIEGHDQAIKSLFDAIRELMTPPEKPRREIGFHIKEDRVAYRVRRK